MAKRRPVPSILPRPSKMDIAKAVEAQLIAAGKQANEVLLSNGILMRVMPTSQEVMRRMISQRERPKPPVQMIEELGREEENEDDPAYQDALEQYDQLLMDDTYRVLMFLGTEVVSVPPGWYMPEDPRWIHRLAAGGIKVNEENEATRYVDWIQLYAIRTVYDNSKLIGALMARVGALKESEVMAAIERFQGNPQRLSDLRGRYESLNPDGDSLPATFIRAGIRAGGTGGIEIQPSDVEEVSEADLPGED